MTASHLFHHILAYNSRADLSHTQRNKSKYQFYTEETCQIATYCLVASYYVAIIMFREPERSLTPGILKTLDNAIATRSGD